MATINRDRLVQLSHLLWQIFLPTFWWSGPGLGKTQTHLALARFLNAHIEVLVGASRLPEDIGGYPLPVTEKIEGDGEVHYVRRLCDTWIRRVKEALVNKRPTIILLDDFTTCNEAMEAAFYRVVQEKYAGDENLEGAWFSAAGNPPGTAAGARPLSHAMANRFCHFRIPYDPADWAKRRRRGFPLPTLYKAPENWTALIPKWNSAVEVFAEVFRAQLIALNAKAGDDPSGEVFGFPADRPLDNLGRGLAVIEAAIPGDDKAAERDEHVALLAEGLIGTKAALLFLPWLKEQDIPNPEDLLSAAGTKETINLPTRGDSTHIALSGVVQAVKSQKPADAERWLAALRVFNAAPADIAASLWEEIYEEKPANLELSSELLQLIGRYSVLVTGSKKGAP